MFFVKRIDSKELRRRVKKRIQRIVYQRSFTYFYSLFITLAICAFVYFALKSLPRKDIWQETLAKARYLLYEQENSTLYNKHSNYLIKTNSCAIPNMDPFDQEVWAHLKKPDIIKCDGEILTYIAREGDKTYLVINQNISQNEDLECSYQAIDRDLKNVHPDWSLINVSDIKTFKNRTLLDDSYTLINVACEEEAYKNYHYVFNNPKQKDKTSYDASKFNVLIIGLDAMSRSSLLRTMPKTVEVLMQNDFIDLKGYNKIRSNTFPNLIAVSTGAKREHETGHFVDSNDYIWHHYKMHNYTTLYSEDCSGYDTFNYVEGTSRGFQNKPTDYYLAPYFLALHKLKRKNFCKSIMCFGPENIGLRMTEFVKEYTETVQGIANHFGFFWMNSFSHNDLTCPMNMDEPFAEMFQHLNKTGIFHNTFVIFMSDHGWRFGKLLETDSGWLENRLPFNFISVPKSFQKMYKDQYQNLLENSKKLTSPYDLYMTLHHLLSLQDPSHDGQLASGCPTCNSLFDPISDKRTCREAGIQEYWCACSYMNYVKTDPKSSIATHAASYAIDHINLLVRHIKYAKLYSLDAILDFRMFYKTDSDINYLMLQISTIPSAKFEINMVATETNQMYRFTMLDVERLNMYGPTSWCCGEDNEKFRKYCYCSYK